MATRTRPTTSKAKPAARKRPSRVNEQTKESIANEQPKSREQAEFAHKHADRALAGVVESGSWPLAPDGYPLVRIEMSAAELIPSGNFANVSIGPARITMMIDPRNPEALQQEERENITSAMNMLAEVVEMDVIGEQRDIVIDSLGSKK